MFVIVEHLKYIDLDLYILHTKYNNGTKINMLYKSKLMPQRENAKTQTEGKTTTRRGLGD